MGHIRRLSLGARMGADFSQYGLYVIPLLECVQALREICLVTPSRGDLSVIQHFYAARNRSLLVPQHPKLID